MNKFKFLSVLFFTYHFFHIITSADFYFGQPEHQDQITLQYETDGDKVYCSTYWKYTIETKYIKLKNFQYFIFDQPLTVNCTKIKFGLYDGEGQDPANLVYESGVYDVVEKDVMRVEEIDESVMDVSSYGNVLWFCFSTNEKCDFGAIDQDPDMGKFPYYVRDFDVSFSSSAIWSPLYSTNDLAVYLNGETVYKCGDFYSVDEEVCNGGGYCDENGCNCFKNYDIETICSNCTEPGFDYDSKCTICSDFYDLANDCKTCLPNFDYSTECTECIGDNFDLASNCTKCKGNYDIDSLCFQCIEGYDLKTGCTAEDETTELEKKVKLYQWGTFVGTLSVGVILGVIIIFCFVVLIVQGKRIQNLKKESALIKDENKETELKV